MSDLPLSGMRVIDLTNHIAGPYCTKLLADWGADVVKVENPQGGDPARRMGPFIKDNPDHEGSGLFLYLNTNKRSLTLNLKSEMGLDLFKRLIKDADIVVESFRPGTMDSLHLSYEDLERLKPALVVTSISNFGQTGPYRDYKGSDITLSAVGVMTYQQRYQTGAIHRLGGTQSLFKAGIVAFNASMAALIFSATGGQGQHLDISIMESAATGDNATYAHYSYTGAYHTGLHLAGLQGHPACSYWCKDGAVWMATGLGNIELLALIMGQPQLMENKVFGDRYTRQERHEEFDKLIEPWLMEHGKKEIEKLAQEVKMPFGAILNVDEVMNDEHLKEREFFVGIDHPRTGKLSYPGTAIRMSSAARRSRAPLLGEHTHDILSGSLGLSPGEVTALKGAGVV